MILSKFLALILHTYTSQLYKHAHCQLFWFPSFLVIWCSITFLRVIPTLNHYSDIISDIPSRSIYGIVSIVILTFYLASVLTYFLAYTLTFLLTIYLFFSDILCGIYSDVFFGILSRIYSDILSGIFSGIHSGILSDILSDILSGILSGISSEILCGWGPAGACSWGPAGTTLIRGLLLGPCRGHCDLALAVEVRRGTTLIPGLLFRSGEDQRDHELAGKVRQILGLLFRRGGDHCDLALAVGARRRPLRSRACSWVEVAAEVDEEEEKEEEASWHKISQLSPDRWGKMVLSLHGVSISISEILVM